jgi:hypothetical protein
MPTDARGDRNCKRSLSIVRVPIVFVLSDGSGSCQITAATGTLTLIAGSLTTGA